MSDTIYQQVIDRSVMVIVIVWPSDDVKLLFFSGQENNFRRTWRMVLSCWTYGIIVGCHLSRFPAV